MLVPRVAVVSCCGMVSQLMVENLQLPDALGTLQVDGCLGHRRGLNCFLLHRLRTRWVEAGTESLIVSPVCAAPQSGHI